MDIIIGAGASGLSYASFTSNDYLIIESDVCIGGYCKTIKQDGFVWDYSGHFFHFRNPKMKQHICKYINKNTLQKCSKHSMVNYHGFYIDTPFQKNIHQLPKNEFIDCLYDLFHTPSSTHESFKEMLYCKFGKSISDKFLIPYNEKLYACNLDKLDSNAMGRFFPHADKIEIIDNFKNKNNSSYNDYFHYPKGGAIEYINSLYKQLDSSKLKLNEQVININPITHTIKTTKSTYKYDNLVSTIPFPNLLDLSNISYNKSIYSWNKVLVFNLGFNMKGNDTVNNWIYIPDSNVSFYRVGYYDNIFSDNRMSLYVEVGFSKNHSVEIDYWFKKILNDLKHLGIITCQKLISYHHVLMDPAYVHITRDSINDVSKNKEKLKFSDIYTIGRYGSWTYCSIEDGMIEAKTLAKQLRQNK